MANLNGLFFAVLVLIPLATVAQTKEVIYSVPDINGRATLLIRPQFPDHLIAKEDGTSLTLRIVVDTNGDVVSAKCSLTCPAEAAAIAEAAATASKFRPLFLSGRAVRFEGTLTYTIAMSRVNWYRFATALQSTFIFDNLSLGPVASMLTNEFAVERSKLQDLDNGVELRVRWEVIKSVKETLRRRLDSKEAWWFDLGFAMRKVTSPFQSDKKLDLSEVQEAIVKLAAFVQSAPAGVSTETVESLRALSNFKIEQSMPPEEVNRTIFQLSSKIRPN